MTNGRRRRGGGLVPYEGDLRVLGQDPWNSRDRRMRDASFIADVAVLPRWLRVSQALDYMAGVHPRFDRSKAESLLARTAIRRSSRVREMSKGMVTQPQLHLALVMAIDARLLVLDEPTLGLDILYRKQFYDALLSAAEAGGPHASGPATLSAVRLVYWSARRELWEHRWIYITPLIVAAVFLVGFVIAAARMPAPLPRNAQLTMHSLARLLEKPFDFASGALMLTYVVVAVVYCLAALHGERSDRSILFWKSLPGSITWSSCMRSIGRRSTGGCCSLPPGPAARPSSGPPCRLRPP